MTQARSARRLMGTLAAFFGSLFVLWTAASLIDLGDGETWEHTKRRYVALRESRGFDVNEFGFYRVARSQHPRQFRTIVILRGIMPSVLFGVLCAVNVMGWSAQPRLDHPGGSRARACIAAPGKARRPLS